MMITDTELNGNQKVFSSGWERRCLFKPSSVLLVINARLSELKSKVQKYVFKLDVVNAL